MDRNDLRSQSLDLLRFPLAVVVLFIHAWYDGVPNVTNHVPLFKALNGLIAGLLLDQSVPVYFFISGFVFFLNIKMDATTYRRKLRNRVKSLLIPYIVWNSLAIAKLLLFALPCLAFLFADQRTFADMDFSPGALAYSFWDMGKGILPYTSATGEIYPIDSPLWFVRDLMIVVLATPLIHLAIRKTRGYVVAALGAAWFANAFFPLGHHSQLLTAFFFFSWGAYISISRKDIFVEFGKQRKAAAILYFLLSTAYAVAYCRYPDAMPVLKKLNQCAGLVFAYNTAAWLLQHNVCRVNRFLASASFFIYVAHMLIIHEVFMILLRIAAPFTANQWLMALAYAATVPVSVSLLLAVFYLMRRFTPRLLKVVAGRK